MANRLSTEKRAQIVSCLCEGMSIRATARVTGAAKNTIIKLLVDLGQACAKYQDGALVDLPCKRIECDEIWSFCYAKKKNVRTEYEGEFGYGDVWTWTAICADTKLVPSWLVGARDSETAEIFMWDLANRLNHRVQLTTDGHHSYLYAADSAFGTDMDYAMLHKIYGAPEGRDDERRYSPAICTDIDLRVVNGDPDLDKASTSYVERQNLTMRMGMRRFTRLSNGFSKKVENLAHAVSLHYMHYNFARPHQTLTKNTDGYKMTPAMAARIERRIWTHRDIAALLD
ncbi:IS1 family transposase [Mycobacteroides abscessus]|uniref:IS1 family transposase n=1 Tax=Mycobacteroides abscessus TaxID=36809 RepID=UPI0005E99789|nr:IS1 family transposase [Mycobacteroides abscessus]CPW10389.1 Transposase and inactivated derivatives [Mycobacteroides abscessus]